MAESDTVGTDLLSVVPGYQQYQELLSKSALESVMEKLRLKANKDPKHYKSWNEITKTLRTAIMDKRNAIDSEERTNLQKVLDTLQKSIKVTSLQSMVERLDSITRQQGLKLVRQSNTQCYITSDMFYVEILLEHSGEVNDVKIAHGEPEPCPELTKVLRSGNFTEFTKHLEGLSAIYQLNTNSSGQLDCEAQKKLKKKAYSALHHLEYDLSQLWQLQQDLTKDPSKLVHKSPVGILQERQGGYSLKLTYFISPYDLLDLKTKSSITLSVDAIIGKGLGHSVTVCIESSNMHRLQNVSLLTISKNGEKSGPPFAAHSDLNSTTLPASFVLKLQEPIPIAVSILKKIQGVTKISNFVDLGNSQSLLSVIVSDASKGKLLYAGSKNLFVTLPDQHHCYSMKSNHELQGVLISTIPFTHPTHVPQILDFLRQQMLFNTVISSCVRPKSKKDVESALKFDIHSYSTNHIQVTFVHPLDESLAAVDLDLKDITAVKCKIHTLGIDDSLCTDEYASKIMQRCLSIPVTMRAVIRKAHGQQQQKKFDRSNMYSATVGGRNDSSYIPHMSNYGNNLSNGSSLSNGSFSNLASGMCNKVIDGSDLNNLSTIDSENIAFNLHDESSIKASMSTSGAVDHHQIENDSDTSSEKTNLESRTNSFTPMANAPSKPANAMLMSMLNDVPSAASPTPTWNVKPRKRKAMSDSKSPGSVSRSPKRKMSEDENIREQLTPESMPTNSPSMSVDNCNSLPASLPSNTGEMIRTSASLEPYLKSEIQHHGYPQRSTSTDSYLTFRPHQLLNSNESSNPEFPSAFSQNKAHFQSDKDYLGGESGSNLDGSNAPISQNITEKIIEKSSKKIRKNKEATDSKTDFSESLMLKVHDFDSSEGSSSSDFFLKSGGEVESKKLEDSVPLLKGSHFVHGSQPNISTSLKISKTGDGHRVSKSDSKIKQKDGRRSTSEGTSSKRKSEAKKDRKRKQVQSADSTSSRSSAQPIHLDSSLMPPPTLSSDANLTMPNDMQSKRPITVNMKEPSASQSKPSISISSGHLNASGNPSKSSMSKSNTEKPGIKISSRSSHSISGSKLSSDSESDPSSGTKVILNTSSKLHGKLKQSSSSKSTSSSHSGQSSPNKMKSTSLKLKNPNQSHSSSSNPAFSKSQMISSSSSVSLSSSSEEQTSPNSKQSGSSSKSHKSQLRSGKGALNAVIDKLRVSATHAQLPDNFKPNSCGSRPEMSSERIDSKIDRKDVKDCKDSLANKGNEGKNKKYSDQFTVKQSSQGIKLTVTKTKSSDGSSKHGKSKLSSSSSKTVSLGSTTNPNKKCVSSTHITKKTSSSPSSTKKSLVPISKDQTSTSPKTISSTSNLPNPAKTTSGSGLKSSSSSSSSFPKTSSAMVPTVKSPKLSTSSQQIKKKNAIFPESKTNLDVLTKSSIACNPPLELAVTTPSTKLTRLDSNWQLSNTSRGDDELERERTFCMLLEQAKNEGQNGSEQNLTMMKPTDFSIKNLSIIRNELDDKKELFSASSSTDIKRSCNSLRATPVHALILDPLVSQSSEPKSVLLPEPPSKKSILNSSSISTSEEINKALSSFAKVVKQNECLNVHNEDDSSPDDGLVIDCPGTPRLPDQKRSCPNKKEKSPDQKKGRLETVVGLTVDERGEKFDYSQVAFISKTPDQRSPSTANHSRSIPHESWPIDDDLMNMALTIGK